MKNNVITNRKHLTFFLAIVLCILFLSGAGCKKSEEILNETFSFTEPFQVSRGPGGSFCPDFVVSADGAINAVWGKVVDQKFEIIFRRSTDRGASWGASRNLSSNPLFSAFPSIAITSQGEMYATWRELDPDTNKTIAHISRSTDQGTTWSQPAPVSSAVPTVESPIDIAVNSQDNLRVVWCETSVTGYGSDVYFSGSNDNGSNWSQKLKLKYIVMYAKEPIIKIDSNDNISTAHYYYSNSTMMMS